MMSFAKALSRGYCFKIQTAMAINMKIKGPVTLFNQIKSISSYPADVANPLTLKQMEQSMENLFSKHLDPIREDMKEVKKDVAVLKSDVAFLKSDVSKLKTDVAVLQTDMTSLKYDVSFLKKDVWRLGQQQSTLSEITASQVVSKMMGERYAKPLLAKSFFDILRVFHGSTILPEHPDPNIIISAAGLIEKMLIKKVKPQDVFILMLILSNIGFHE
jgi:polyhydroxyalkanoate synthesis regulator phasin